VRTLIADDSSTSRLLLQEILRPYGPVHLSGNGQEAVAAFHAAIEEGAPYDLVCLDIMMPELDGRQALRAMRHAEEARGVVGPGRTKIIMTTALGGTEDVLEAIRGQCDAYLIKPIRRAKLLEEVRRFGLIP
jgi:two-component system chemotaxis response regulator CheY